MTHHLALFTSLADPAADTPPPARWCLISLEGDTAHPVAAADGWPPRTLTPAPDSVNVILCGADVGAHRLVLPTRNRAQALAAAPYALEDHLAESPEKVHVALGPPNADGTVTALVVKRAPLANLVAQLRERGLHGARIVADYQLLTRQDALVVADNGGSTGGRVALARPDGTGFTLETDLAEPLIRAEAEAAPDLPIHAHGLPADMGRRLAAGPGAGMGDRLREAAPIPDASTAQRAMQGGISLRQGAFRTRPPLAERLRPWRPAAALAASVLLAWGGTLLMEGWRYHARADQLQAEASRTLARTGPGLDSLAQARARLRGATTRRGGLYGPLASHLYQGLRDAPAIRLESLRFDAATGTLRATVITGGFGALEDLRSRLARRGVRLEEGAARQNGDRVVSELILSQQTGGA
ncbi:type II secretion system protein GspL [Yunchengibacter salinarum]|uniref:type II secretion system protein GspL n=1 Tax=Yunchengibacter salinarum TaxID=3133399 RepID=UPI0035B64F87